MLYVTTRGNRDVFTAQRALCEKRAPDGGLYLPFRMPRFTPEEIDALAEKPFSKCVAEMLNTLFNTRLSDWDVAFCVGRYPVRLVSMSHRMMIGESWHNPEGRFSWMVRSLVNQIRADGNTQAEPGDWAEVAVRIAVLFGIFGELIRKGIAGRERPVDICVVAGDFSAPMSAWYAREWGLPIGSIVCCCNENNSVWELLHQGQLRTDGVCVSTSIPEADIVLPAGLERLIFGCGGYPEALRYVDVCRRGGMYCPNEAVLSNLRKGLYVSVISERRTETTIPNVFGTHSYLLSPCSALAYAGLLDYRASAGESGYSLILSENSPARDAQTVSRALNISVQELMSLIEKM